MCGTVYGGVPARHPFANLFKVTVYDDNGIVDNHSEGDNQGRQGHRVEFDAEGIEQSQRDEDGNRDGGSSYQSYLYGQQQHDHHHYRHDGNQQFVQEVVHTAGYYLCLIGYKIHADFRGELRLELLDDSIYFFSHLDDVFAFLHFHAQQDALRSVVLDITVGMRVLFDHGSDVFQTDYIARRIGIDYLLLYVVHRVIRFLHMNRKHVFRSLYSASGRHKSL